MGIDAGSSFVESAMRDVSLLPSQETEPDLLPLEAQNAETT